MSQSARSHALCIASLVLLLGCTEGDGLPQVDIDGDGVADTLPPGTVDLTEDFTLPDDSDHLVLEMQNLFIPSGEARIFCRAARWDGPDVGVVSLYRLYTEDFNHHGVIKAPRTPEWDIGPEGETVDCTSQEGPYAGTPTIFSGVRLPGARPSNEEIPTENWIAMPEGLAYSFPTDQRYYGEVHYVNPTPHPILVNMVWVMGLIPDEEVEAYVGAFNHESPPGISVPPGGEHHLRYDCTWEESASILSLGGHMHNYGLEYSIDWNSSEGSVEIYSVPEWQPEFQFGSPQLNWELGELVVAAGDSFTTHCVWDNPGDEPLEFPAEMCASYGVAAPLLTPTYCEGTIVEEVR